MNRSVNSDVNFHRFNRIANACLASLQKYDWPGKHRLYLWLCAKYTDALIAHELNRSPFYVPLDEWCFWLEKGPQNYYLDEFVPFFDKIKHTEQDVSFFDLGADIGTVSALANQYCPNIKQIFAFEPNPKSFAILTKNLAALPHHAFCYNSAVSNFDGLVGFSSDAKRTVDHEGAINPNIAGDTQVVSLDSWLSIKGYQTHPVVVLKVDVEGQEIQAIEGAKDLITSSKAVIVLLEIHPQVLAKTQSTPEDLLNCLDSIRSFDWYVPLLNNQVVDRQREFFEQFPTQQYDLIAVSKTIL